MKLTKYLIAALLMASCALAAPAFAQQGISQKVAVCDPSYPTRCMKPLADGSIAQSGNSFTNVATSTSTVIKAAPGTFVGLIVNTAGTTSSATVYNNTTCTGSKIGTFSTTAQASLTINATASVGICVLTAGGAPADITVIWR